MRQPEMGEIFDGFTIQELLHRGITSNLYLAQDSLTSHSVVLKVPLDTILYHPIQFYHFLNEESLSRYLNHPAVVRFLVRQTSRLYLVQEYIAGQDLNTVLKVRQQFPLADALSVCLHVCDALHYLHGKSILHLDLKPENIMILPTGGIKLVDFGLARHLGLRDYLGADFSEPQGTPCYISPEQLCGNRESKQSDIYSLGVTFYEMLTGELPFKRSDRLADVEQRLYREPVPPRFHDESIPPVIQQIVLKMLRRDLHERYADVDELRHDLTAYSQLEETEMGRRTTKPSVLLSIFKPKDCSIYRKREDKHRLAVPLPGRQILGCVMDDHSSDLVVEEVRREALLYGGNITLLVVLEDDIESGEEVEYVGETMGGGLAQRLDNYIITLKKYQLSVTLRIRRGEVADSIIAMADSIGADIVILGPPRLARGLNRISSLFGGSTIEKVERGLDRDIRVLKPASPGPQPGPQGREKPSAVPEENLRLFLADSWVHHLNSLHQAVNHEAREVEPSLNACPYGEWLEKFVTHLNGVGQGADLLLAHAELHRSIDRLSMLKAGHDNFKEMYRNETLPLLHRFRRLLQESGRVAVKSLGGGGEKP